MIFFKSLHSAILKYVIVFFFIMFFRRAYNNNYIIFLSVFNARTTIVVMVYTSTLFFECNAQKTSIRIRKCREIRLENKKSFPHTIRANIYIHTRMNTDVLTTRVYYFGFESERRGTSRPMRAFRLTDAEQRQRCQSVLAVVLVLVILRRPVVRRVGFRFNVLKKQKTNDNINNDKYVSSRRPALRLNCVKNFFTLFVFIK